MKMSMAVQLGHLSGTVVQTPVKLRNYQKITIKGGGNYAHIAGTPWMDLQAYMIQWAAGRQVTEPSNLGFKLLIDFSGTRLSGEHRFVEINLLDGSQALFPKDYDLTPASFQAHDSGNVLYHIANKLTSKWPWIEKIEPHSSSNGDFFVFTDGNPLQVIHSLIVAKGKYTCAATLPATLWQSFGQVIETELKILGSITAIDKCGYRLEINNGCYAQGVAQMHGHIKAGHLDRDAIG